MRTFLAALAFLLLVTMGAQATNTTSTPPKRAPWHGMTKMQVLAVYGRPRHRARVDGQDVWYYRLKLNEVYGRAMVPFEFSSDNVRFGEIAFDSKGRVARTMWNPGHAAIWVIQ